MTTIYHPNVNTVVPWNANYTFPSQATQMHKQVVKIQPVSGQTHGTAAGQSRRLQILLPSDGYLNAQNSALAFTVSVTAQASSADIPTALGQAGAHELFKRARLLYGGLVIEDIQEYGQLARLMMVHGSEKDYGQGTGKLLEGTNIGVPDDPTTTNVPTGTTTGLLNRRYVIQPMLGLLRCQKLIPLKWMAASLVLELELEDAAEAIICKTSASTLNFSLTDISYIAEIMEFDSVYDTAFYAGMQQMGIPMKFTSFHHQQKTVNGSEHYQIHERARSVKAGYAIIKNGANDVSNADSKACIKGAGGLTVNTFQWRIGGKYQPAQPVDCAGVAPEAYLEAMKVFNTLGDYTFASASDASRFPVDSFVMAQEFENTDVFPNTIAGINAENQSDLTLKIDYTGSLTSNTNLQLHTFVAFDNLLILREGHLVDLVM